MRSKLSSAGPYLAHGFLLMVEMASQVFGLELEHRFILVAQFSLLIATVLQLKATVTKVTKVASEEEIIAQAEASSETEEEPQPDNVANQLDDAEVVEDVKRADEESQGQAETPQASLTDVITRGVATPDSEMKVRAGVPSD